MRGLLGLSSPRAVGVRKALKRFIPKACGRSSRGVVCVQSRKSGLRLRQAVSFGFTRESLVVVAVSRPHRAKPLLSEAVSLGGVSVLLWLPRGCFLGSRLTSAIGPWARNQARSPGSLYFLADLKPGDSASSVSVGGRSVYWARAAGTSSRLLYVTNCKQFAVLSLPSGLERRVRAGATARLGGLSLEGHRSESLGSAGRSIRSGRRPSVRGIARNPVDHPNGGRSNSPCPSRSP